MDNRGDTNSNFNSNNSGDSNNRRANARRVYGDRVAMDPSGNRPNTESRPSVPRRTDQDPQRAARRPVNDYGLQTRQRPNSERDRQRPRPQDSRTGSGEFPDFIPSNENNMNSGAQMKNSTSTRQGRPSGATGSSGSGRGSSGSGSGGGGGKPPRRRKPKRKGNRILGGLKMFLIFAIIIGAIGSVVGFAYVQSVIKDTTAIDPSHLYDSLGENSVILDANGKVLETLQDSGVRKIVKYNEISPAVIDAYVAVEDKTFWTHKGFNFVRLAGSIWQSMTSGNRIKGTSTITQQLARNIYLVESRTERSLNRKIKEAYYAIQLEKYLTKEQIIEAYLNTIYLGANANGIEAASQAYFSKSAKDLDYIEAALLAGIPAYPAKYPPMLNLEKEKVKPDDIILDDSDDRYTLVYNKGCEKRYAVCIKLMYDNGKITKEQYETAKNTDLVTKLKPNKPQRSDITSYFADMVKDDVVKDLMAKYGYTKEEASYTLFNKGLKIHSTVDYGLQKSLEEAYDSQSKNMPRITLTFDGSGNVINKNGQILLYQYENIINRDQEFVLPASDFKYNDNGDLVLLKGKRLNFYSQFKDGQVVGVQVVLKSVFKNSDLSEKGITPRGTKNLSNFMTYAGKDLLIPSEFKSYDESHNVVVSKAFLEQKPDFFKPDSRGYLLVNKDNYVIGRQGIVQPQSATVVIDYHTGALKAVVGGRNVQGQKIYNRALNPRQPGSSIKPLAVYLPAIATKKYTAASVIDDAPTYLGPDNTRWPLNWYEASSAKYWGLQTLRESMMWSINVNAVKIAKDLGLDTSLEFLKKLGITSVVESGPTNDMNLSAMALGGMSKGISPMEMARAYGVIANNGLMVDTITFTSVEDRSGEVILEKTPAKNQVIDEASAYITLDMMRSTVTGGLAKTAAIVPGNTGIPVAGKTGTTSNKMDAWFVGASPYYVAAVWFGNDLNIPLDQGSKVSAQFWQVAMKKLHQGLSNKEFTRPSTGISDVTIDTKSGLLPSELSKSDSRGTIKTELFLTGTEPTLQDDVHISARICKASNKLATDACPADQITNRVFVKRKVPLDLRDGIFVKDMSYDLPTTSCPIHGSGGGGGATTSGSTGGTTYKDATIALRSNGTYEVLKPFNVQLFDNSSFTIPAGSRIGSDKSITIPDGSVIMPYDIANYPDLKKLQGTPVKSSTPTGNTPKTENPDSLIDQLDSGPPQN